MPDRPRDNQAGFALTELIVAMTVGLIILLAAFLLLDRAHGASNEIADRQDAVQRGRQAMELLTRQIRSQVCLGGFEEPITDGTNNSVTFYADLTDGSKNVERRTITFDPADGVNGTIKQFIYPGAGTYPVLTFPGYPGSPSETTTILTKATAVTSPATPFLRYYAYDPAGAPGSLRQLTTPLSTADAPLVVMVKVAFVALPERKIPRNKDATTFYNDVYVRLANPTLPNEGPRCL